MVDEVDLRLPDRDIAVLRSQRAVDHLGQGPGDLDTGRSTADDDELHRALVDAARVAVGFLEELEDACPQAHRVVHRVEREGVFLDAPGVLKK